MKVLVVARVLVLLGLSIVISCAGKATIDLVYHTVGADVSPCKSSVAVVALEDQRSSVAVGERRDGQQIYGKPFAAEWISRALAEELEMAGCEVEYHDKGSDFNTDYLVTGEVKEAYFKQESMSGFVADMRLRIVVNKGGEKVLGKEFKSTVRKNTLPSSGAYTEVLSELLQTMLREVVPDVCEVFK